MFLGRPQCEGCGSRDACASTGALRPEYPRCRTPLRGVDVDRTAALFAWLARVSAGLTPSEPCLDGAASGPKPRARFAGPFDAPAVRALEHAVLARFRRDRVVFSDVLEASWSCDREGAHLYRFSYAFPGFHADPEGVAATLLDFCRPFGAGAEGACRTVLRAARSRAVAQILFGFADDGGGRSRVKLYLQFHAHQAAAALDLAGGMLGMRLRPQPGAPLHLLCLDLGARGLAGAKLYFAMDRLRVDDVASPVGAVPLAAALAELGVSELRGVLAIHRVAGPGDGGLARPVEIDFSLRDNDLLWDDVRALPSIAALLDRSPEISALAASFRLAVRRLSLSVQGDKLNGYYVLTEVERSAEVDRGG